MIGSLIVFIAAFSLSSCQLLEGTSFSDCGHIIPSVSRTVKLSINSKRNGSGDWVDTFSARTETGNSSNSVSLDLTHRVTECEGKRVLYIQGVTGVIARGGRLLFHPRCAKNVAIVEKGRSAVRINQDDPINSTVFTNRPLKNDEIFEVRLDKKNTKFGISLGIGIVTRSPADVDILPEMWKSPVAWIWHHHIVHNNGIWHTRYAFNLDDIKVGDKVGVMRSEFGTLHFFVNGVDQGPAVSNIPYPVYGLLELWHNAVKATIVEESSPFPS